MFTQECFIRNNTKSLRYKLEKLGYNKSVFFQGDLPFIYVGDCNTLGAEYNEANYNAPVLFHTNNSKIDCGTNENLFLAIAALRDDSDINQWFTDGNTWKNCILNKCDIDSWYRRFGYGDKMVHKATVKELVEHFKGE